MVKPIYIVEVGDTRKVRFAFDDRDEAERFANALNETDIDYKQKATVFEAARFRCVS